MKQSKKQHSTSYLKTDDEKDKNNNSSNEERYNKCESLFKQYITCLRNLDEDKCITYENDKNLNDCINYPKSIN